MATFTSSNAISPDMREQMDVSSQQPNSNLGSYSVQQRPAQLNQNQGGSIIQRGSVQYYDVVNQSYIPSTAEQETRDTMSANQTSITQYVYPEGNERGFPVTCLKIFGLVQIVISGISCLLSLIRMGINVSKQRSWYAFVYFFVTTSFPLSGWFLITGCIPICISRQRPKNWNYLKVSFMLCSILGEFCFLVQSEKLLERIMVQFDGLARANITATRALNITIAVTVLLEAVVAIVSVIYCYCSSWNSSVPNQQGIPSDTLVPTERVFPVKGLRILGLVQIVSGCISCILSVTVIIVKGTEMKNYVTNITMIYIICIILFVWFILTGCIPMRLSRQRQNNRKYSKILFMACNVLGVMAFIVICQTILGCNLQELGYKTVPAFQWITFAKVLQDLVVAVISIFYCCCTEWDTTIQQFGMSSINDASSVHHDTPDIDGNITHRHQDHLESLDYEREVEEQDTDDSSPLLNGAPGKQEQM